MQDNAQVYVKRNKTPLLLKDDSISFSFIPNFLHSDKLIEKSVLSIEDIGDELGNHYEIIIPMEKDNRQSSLLLDLEKKIENLKLLRFDSSNQGFQKRTMQSNSFGSYIVLFDPSRIYEIEFSDLLHSFVSRRDEVVLYSDLIVIPSVIFRRIGTWKDLMHSEDVDILARISSITGIIAYNPEGMSIKIPVNEPVLFNPDSGNIRIGKILESIRRQRDQIIGSCFSMKDLTSYYRIGRKKGLTRLLLALFSLFISRASRVKPYRLEVNNFVSVMDEILESLILGDFKRYTDFTEMPKLSISETDLKFLRAEGKVWGTLVGEISTYVSDL